MTTLQETEVLDSAIDKHLMSIIETYARYGSSIINSYSIIKVILKKLGLWRNNESKIEHRKVVERINERIEVSTLLVHVEDGYGAKKWYEININELNE